MEGDGMKNPVVNHKKAVQMEQDMRRTIKSNTLKLLEYYKITKTQFKEDIGISSSKYSKLYGDSSEKYSSPVTLTILSSICAYFNVSMYELCCTNIRPGNEEEELPLPIDTRTNRPPEEYGLYLGTYEGLYFDTSRPIGEEDRSTPSAFSHVILTIYKGSPKEDKPQGPDQPVYKAVAIFNCPPEMVHQSISDGLDSAATDDYIEKYYSNLSSEYPHIYWGELTLTDQFAYLDVRQTKSRDIVHIILHNKAAIASPRRRTYIGGLGVMASSARGAERMPCAQQILLSRYSLSAIADEELAELLYLSMPKLSLHESAQNLIAWVKGLYLPGEASSPLQQLNEDQKTAAVEVQLNRMIMEQMRKNAFRYRKIASSQDSELYRRLEPLRRKTE